MAADQRRPRQIAGALQGLALKHQSFVAIEYLNHRLAAIFEELLMRAPVYRKRFLAGEIGALRVCVEIGDDRFELANGAAQTLAVLLLEFWRL